MNASVSVALVFHSNFEELERALGSLRGQNAEVHVVDVSEHGSAEDSARRFGATWIAAPQNRGYGWACNIGIAHSSSDVVVVGNSDIEFVAGSLDELVASAVRGRRLVGPRQTHDSKLEVLDSVQSDVSAAASLRRWWGVGRPAFDERRREFLAEADSGVDVLLPKGFTLSGAVIAATREVWSELLGFDEAFFLYQEDAELGCRAASIGIESVLAGSSVVLHESGTHRRGHSADALCHAVRSERIAWKKVGRGVFFLSILQFTGLALRGVYALGKGNRRMGVDYLRLTALVSTGRLSK